MLMKKLVINNIDEYYFGKSLYIYGENGTGKTAFLEILDYILGKSSSKRIKVEEKYSLKNIELIFLDNTSIKIEFIPQTKYYFNNIECTRENYMENISKIIFKREILFESNNDFQQNMTYRNMFIFNFFHENNVGAQTVLLSKLRENKYYMNLDKVFMFALGKENNLDEKNKKMKDLKKEFLKKKELQLLYDDKIKTMNAIQSKINDDCIKNSNEVQFNKFINLNAKKLELERALSQKKNTDLIDFLKKIINIETNEKYVQQIEELLEKLNSRNKNTEILMKDINNKIENLKIEIENLEAENDFNELLSKYHYLKTKELVDESTNIENLKTEIKKLEKSIYFELNSIYSILESDVSEIMLIYLKKMNEKYLKGKNKILKTDILKFAKNKSFDPILYEKTVKNESEEYKPKYIGSHTYSTFFQLSYIFALHEFSNKNNGNIAKFIILDDYSQPLSIDNKDLLFEYIETFMTRNNNIQVIVLDKIENRSYANIFDKSYEFNNKKGLITPIE